jgi:hypothetical protein
MRVRVDRAGHDHQAGGVDELVGIAACPGSHTETMRSPSTSTSAEKTP